MKNALAYFARFYREDTPESFSRLITTLIVVFILGWDTSFVYHTHALPDAGVMAGQLAFMTAFYVVNKTTGAYTTAKTAGANQGGQNSANEPGTQPPQ